MKHFAVLTMVALFGLGLVNGAAVAQDTKPAETPAPTHATHPVVIQETTNLSYYQLTVIGLLTVIAILMGLALSQLSAAKTAMEKLANK